MDFGDFVLSFLGFLWGSFILCIYPGNILNALLETLFEKLQSISKHKQLFKRISKLSTVLVFALCIGFSAHVSFSGYIIDARKSSSPAQTVQTAAPTPQPTVQIIDYSARTQSTGGALYGNSMIVYVSDYGKIHRYSSCSGMKYYTEMTYSAALAAGYSRCSNCF